MTKIKTLSYYMILILHALKVILPALVGCTWLFMTTPFIQKLIRHGNLYKPLDMESGPINLSTVSWTPVTQCMGFLSDIIGNLPLFISFFYLTKIFKNYHKGLIFNEDNGRYYYRLGWLMFFQAFATSLSHTLLVLAVTFTNPPGERLLTISVGSPNVWNCWTGVCLIIVSWVMMEGAKLQNEQKYTI